MVWVQAWVLPASAQLDGVVVVKEEDPTNWSWS